MRKIRLYVSLFLVVLSTFSFNLRTVNALMSKTSEPTINKFTVANFYEDRYEYNLNDSGTVTRLGEKTIYKAVGETVNIDNPSVNVSNYILQSITLNGSGSYNIGDTYTQPASDLNIVYTYRPKQTYTVTHRGSNYTFTGNNTAIEGSTYTATVTANNLYNITGATITMGGRTLSEGSGYTYSDETLSIPNVNGNIDINVTTQQTCLAAGTKVMLWDGTYKNIEDVRYNDLLKVWNHDIGAYGYEYAGWIESGGKADKYIKVTFSDGSILKIIGDHSLFSKRLNKYVNISSNELHIGDEVVSLKKGIHYVSITNIEEVTEEINYYHIISTRYFNLITNNILSTFEIYSNVSNFMDFEKNMKWLNTEEVRSDMFTYEDLPQMEKYLFKVFRLEETKYLLINGLVSQTEFDDLYNNYLLNNDKRLIPPKNNNGKYLWMVTTSNDNNPSSTTHQMVEDSEYVVPTPNNKRNFKYWYNHSDNKHYQPGDKIKVDSSMYLEAIYE